MESEPGSDFNNSDPLVQSAIRTIRTIRGFLRVVAVPFCETPPR